MVITKVEFKKFERGNLKGFASVTFDDALIVTGIKLMWSEKTKSFFPAMPSTEYTDKDGSKKYNDIVFPVSKELRAEMTEAIVSKYKDGGNDVYSSSAKTNSTKQSDLPF